MIKNCTLIIIMFLFVCIDCVQSFADEKFDPQLFSTQSEFSLSSSAKIFPPATSNDNKLITKSAFVVLTNEFFNGKTNALEILFFTESLTEDAEMDILNNDGKTIQKKDHTILVLFIDKDNKIWQVNLTYVIPGTTAARTVAWKAEELKNFSSDYLYDGKRLKLKSKGNYNEPDSQKDSVNLTWDVNLDLPVFNKLGLKGNK